MPSKTAVARTKARAAAAVARAESAFVPTPPDLAEVLTAHLRGVIAVPSGPAGARVLDPSAGTGSLGRAVLGQDSTAELLCLEPDEDRFGELVQAGFPARRCTFEEYTAAPADLVQAVIMNPPFSLPGRPAVWAEHLVAAWQLLAPGGRLVAVAPGHLSPRGAGAQALELISAHGSTREWRADRAQIRAGFPPAVTIVSLVKAMPPHAPDRPAWVLTPAAGLAAGVDELDVTPRGALQAPVQRYADRWDGDRLRTVRYVGTCVVCGRVLWAHDDGREDASCWAANCVIEPDHDGQPEIGLCLNCHHSGREVNDRAQARAASYWASTAAADG